MPPMLPLPASDIPQHSPTVGGGISSLTVHRGADGVADDEAELPRAVVGPHRQDAVLVAGRHAHQVLDVLHVVLGARQTCVNGT